VEISTRSGSLLKVIGSDEEKYRGDLQDL